MSYGKILGDLEAISVAIQDDKVNARKKAADQLNSLLQNPNIISLLCNQTTLNDNSSNTPTHNSGSNFTWNNLYRATFRYMLKEAEKLLKDNNKIPKEPMSQGFQASKMAREGNQKFQAVGLLNNVIKKANQSWRPMIRIELLLEDMISILKLDNSNPYLRKTFGAFAVQIILNRVLSVPYYFQYISVGETSEKHITIKKNTWKVLLKISMQLFEVIPENLDFHSCCALLHGILSNGLLYSDVHSFLKKYFRFFEKVFQSTRLQQCSLETKKIFLDTTNIFMMNMSHDCRQQTCFFGESVLRKVIEMYDERNTSYDIVKFLRIQMALHHPKGVSTDKDGAFYGQISEWKSHLMRVYSNLIDTTIKNQKKSNKGRTYGNRNYELRADLVDLAVEVCNQLLLNSDQRETLQVESVCAEITQIVPIDITQEVDDEASKPKRRKISISFQTCLLDAITDSKTGNSNEKNNDEYIIPYLQIIGGLMKRFPGRFPYGLIKSTAHVLLDVIQDARNVKVKSAVLQCCSNMLQVHNTLGKEFPAEQFIRLWEAAANAVSLNQCVMEGNFLLRMMIPRIGVLQHEQLQKLYSRYFNKLIKCNEYSTKTLLHLIAYCPILPEHSLRQMDIISTQSQDPNSHRSIDLRNTGKYTLLKWLSPFIGQQDGQHENSTEILSPYQSLEHHNARLVATMLFAMTVETTKKKFTSLIDCLEHNGLCAKQPIQSENANSINDFVRELEISILETNLLLHSEEKTEDLSELKENPVQDTLRDNDGVKRNVHDVFLIEHSNKILEILTTKEESQFSSASEENSSIKDPIIIKSQMAFGQMKVLINYLDIAMHIGCSVRSKNQESLSRIFSVFENILHSTTTLTSQYAEDYLEHKTRITQQILTATELFRDWSCTIGEFLKCINTFILFNSSIKIFENLFEVTTKVIGYICNYHKNLKDLDLQRRKRSGKKPQRPMNDFEDLDDDVGFIDDNNSRNIDSDTADSLNFIECLDTDETNGPEEISCVRECFSVLCLICQSTDSILQTSNVSGATVPSDDIINGKKEIEMHTIEVLHQFLTTFADEQQQDQVLGIVFDAVNMLIDLKKDKNDKFKLSFEAVHQIIGLLQEIGKRSISPKKFSHAAMYKLILSLKLLLPHLHQPNVGENPSEKKNFLTFVKRIVTMQKNSDYQRYSVPIQLQLVELFGAISAVDPHQSWSTWSGKYYNMCSQDDRECMIDPEEEIGAANTVLRFVNHPCHNIRMRAAKVVLNMFRVNREFFDKPTMQQKKREFAALHSILMHVVQVDFKEGSSDVFVKDETVNRIGTIMKSLAPIALVCPYLERETLVGLILLHKSTHVNIDALSQVLTQLARFHLGTKNELNEKANSLQQYLEPNLGFILKDFFRQGYSLNEFPYQLFGSSSLQRFVSDYNQTITTNLLWCCNTGHEEDSLNELLKLMPNNTSTQEILSNNFAAIHSMYVPVIATKTMHPDIMNLPTGRSGDLAKTESLDTLLTQNLAKQFDSLVSETMPDVLANVLKQVYDPEKISSGQQYIGSLLMRPNPPTTNESLIMNVFDYYDQIVEDKIPLFSFLSSDKFYPDCLERIVTKLMEPLKRPVAAKEYSLQIQSLHGLKLFIRRLNKELLTTQGCLLNKQVPFLVWYISSAMKNLIYKHCVSIDSILSKDAVFMLTLASENIIALVKTTLDIKDKCLSLQIMNRVTVPLANCMVKLIIRFQDKYRQHLNKQKSGLREKWLQILHLIIIEFKKRVPKAEKVLIYLDPLPQTEDGCFDNLQVEISKCNDENAVESAIFSTEDMLPFIDNFVQTDIDTIRVEVLEELFKKLCQNRRQISKMLDSLEEGQGYSENAATSALHHLVIRLVETSLSEDELLSRKANLCLGELGPINLSTLVLKPSAQIQNQRKFSADKANYEPIQKLIQSLATFLLHHSNTTVHAASQALKHVLATSAGKTALDNFSTEGNQILPFLSPFTNSLSSATIDKNAISKSAVDASIDPHIDLEYFDIHVNNQDIWCHFKPSYGLDSKAKDRVSYGNWLRDLVTSLLECMTKKRFGQYELSPVLGRHLLPLCREEPDFCENILPDLILDILSKHYHDDPKNIRHVLSKYICTFLEKHYQYMYETIEDRKGEKQAPYTNMKCVQIILAVIEYLRMNNIPKPSNEGIKSNKNAGIGGQTTTVWQNNFWLLDINYLHVARAALDCSSYFAACLYCDLWCQQIKENNQGIEHEFASNIFNVSLVDMLQNTFDGDSHMMVEVERCQSILFEAYSKLGDNEAIYGCGSNRLFNKASRVLNTAMEKKNLEAFSMYDRLIQAEKGGDSGLMESLLRSGCYHTLHEYAKSKHSERVNLNDQKKYQYECAWRLSKWDDIEDFQPNNSELFTDLLPQYRHSAFQDVFLHKDLEAFQDNISLASKSVSSMISFNVEDSNHKVKAETSPVSILKGLTYLRGLNEAIDLTELTRNTCSRDSIIKIFNRFEEVDRDLIETDFSYVEPIWTQRQVLLRNILDLKFQFDCDGNPIVQSPVVNNDIQKEIERHFIKQSFQLCNHAIKKAQFHVAENSLMEIKSLIQKNKTKMGNMIDVEDQAQYNEAILAWASKEKDVAIFLMKSLNKKLEANKENVHRASLYPEVLRTLGCWMFELKSESSSVILQDYFKRSTQLYEEQLEKENSLPNKYGKPDEYSLIDEDKVTEAYGSLASFCDDQYRNIVNYMQSKDFEDKSSLMKQIKEEGKNIKKVGSSVDDSRKAAMILERHSNLDLTELQKMEESRLQYLLLAVENYAKALSNNQNPVKDNIGITKTTYHDLRIFRLISLWFSNAQNSNVNISFGKYMQAIPSYKFTGLLYQLCARMVMKAVDGIHAKEFPQLLLRLIKRCTMDHPYHTLPIVFALANSNADEKEIEGVNAKKFCTSKSEERSEVAQKLLKSLAANTNMSQLIDRMGKVCEAYIKLAYLPMSEKDKPKMERQGKVEIEKNQIIRNIKNFEDVPLVTIELPVNKLGDYPKSSFSAISRFTTDYSNVGGITAPKKISCLGTDGKWRPQLVKGKDDLRQDAVMEQVFGLLNTLLKKDDVAQKKRLQIRTYKVVAMSQRSGVLEWCENTNPIREFLVGSDQRSGAHARYYPSDLKALECRKMLTEGQKKNTGLKTFENICKKFHPVMRHFFHEKFPSPGIHMERRLAYTRSAATSSMVGYILGLGDRHVQNILLDMSTAELIHIDLGVAFEQGKILPTPETIPFRLSRDIIDGFGPCGVEGTFRRSCETTLNILRENKEGIMTILEVLIYDPLYNWSLTPAKAYRLQYGRDADANTKSKWENNQQAQEQIVSTRNNKMAERVLLRVTEKLNGMEEGYNLSVKGQVNLLIQQATDPSRLCALFPGWQPYI